MQYDRLAETVERHFPQWTNVVQDARLFVMQEPESEAPCVQDEGEVFSNWHPDEQLIENFRLPFESVAIESRGCVVLQTVDSAARTFNAFAAMNFTSDTLFATAKLKAFPASELILEKHRWGEAAIVSDLNVFSVKRNKVEPIEFSMKELSFRKQDREAAMGDVKVDLIPAGTRSGTRFKIRGEVVTAEQVMADKDTLKYLKASYPQLIASLDIAQANMAFMQINCALLLALRICEPSSFVVEHTHVDFVPKEPKKGKVIRSPYRPQYIVLTPGEIRKRFIRDDDGESIPSGMTRRPHERRGHFRKLTSEKFVSKRNHVIWIKPCWVGKTEGVIGKNRYVVRLDI